MVKKETKIDATAVGAGLVSAQRNKYDANTVGTESISAQMQKQSAITLIALIITIIIMLILSGVVLSLTIGEHGIFKIAQDAGKNYTEAEKRELAELDKLYKELGIENLPQNTPETDAGTFVKIPEGWFTQTPVKVRDTTGIEIEKTQLIATVDAVSDGTNHTIPVPKGFYYVGGNVSSGVVISDDSRDLGKYAGETKAPGGVVPAGAVYNQDGTVKEENSLTQEEKNAVIFGNQFVWIPCTEANYTKVNTFPSNASNYDTSTNPAELGQIKKYGGFYIGRYEAGVGNIKFAGNNTLNVPTGTSNWFNENFTYDKVESGGISTKAGEIPYYHADYNTALAMSEKMYNTSNVYSGLITGTMWDVVMKYISEKSDYSDLNNAPWGNYNSDTGLIYEQGRGRYISINSDNGAESGSFTVSDISHHYGIRTTGFSDSTRKNNIYDLAGNLYECTTEHVSGDTYLLRGGCFNNVPSSRPVCYRAHSPSNSAGTDSGFRPVLYMR